MTGKLRWHNEPPFFEQRGEALIVRTAPETDFWNNTFYGFNHHNGHFQARTLSVDFSAVPTFSADYGMLYDQPVRVAERTEAQTSIEFNWNNQCRPNHHT